MVIKLPPALEVVLDQALKARLARGGARGWASLANQIHTLSQQYIDRPGETTPWDSEGAEAAYLAYFLPLNALRMMAVLKEWQRQAPKLESWRILDLGSGPGTAQLTALAMNLFPRSEWICIENAPRAVGVHRELLAHWVKSASRVQPDVKPIAPEVSWTKSWPAQSDLAVASYSLIENPEWIERLSTVPHLVVLEPSTREQGRKLMELRRTFLKRGFQPLAPCTHAHACPLLEESQSDWCHHRLRVELPSWFAELGPHLKMRNDTLTLSYLILSRHHQGSASQAPSPPRARIIGDTLRERGKWRQAVCRGPQREFLSWLTRHGEPQVLERGTIIQWPTGAVAAGNEWRPQGPLKILE